MQPSKKAFTIVEVLVAATIMSIIIGTVITLLLTTTNFFDSASIDTDLFNRGQVVMEKITRELNSGLLRTDPNGTSQLVVANNSDNIVVTYTVTTGWDTSGPIFDSGPRTFTWYKPNHATASLRKTLTYTTTGGSAELIAKDVAGFNIAYVTSLAVGNTFQYLIWVTLDKEILTPASTWRTQEFKENLYIQAGPK